MRHTLPALTLTLVLAVATPALPALAHDGQDHAAVPAAGAGAEPQHVDPAPKGVDVTAKLSTGTLVEQSGVDERRAVYRSIRAPGASSSVPRMALSADGQVPVKQAVLSVPAGTPGSSSITSHVQPSCSGTGADGRRVQVLYAYEAGTPNRLASVRTALLSAVADVDDTFALSSSGGSRRVRWVHDASCVPTVAAVVLPRGTFAGEDLGLPGIRAAAEAQRVVVKDRKLLTFADANGLCGVGEIFADDEPGSTNFNNSGPTMVARVDTACWYMRPGSHSTPAHELMHMLGGVQETARNATTFNHCTDENDTMCYADGGELPRTTTAAFMRLVCAFAGYEARFDCNHDDYYNSGTPKAGTYLASHWNTANSSYLDVMSSSGAPLQRPNGVISGAGSVRPGLPLTVRVSSDVPARVSWTSNSTACLPSSRTSTTLTVQCPTSYQGTLVLDADLTASNGLIGRVSKRVSLSGAGTSALGVSLSAPSSVQVGSYASVTATARSGTQPVRASLLLQTRSSTGSAWRSVSTGTASTAGRLTWNVRRTTAGTSYYRAVVQQSSSAHWGTATPAVRKVVAVRRTTASSVSLRTGRPNTLKVAVRTSAHQPVAHQRLALQYRRPGSRTWHTVTHSTTNSQGAAAKSVQPRRTTYYRWVYPGSASLSGSTSPTKTVRY